MEFKYKEITMHLMLCLMHVRARTCCERQLSYRTSLLACSIAQEGILYAIDLLAQVVYPSEYFHSTIVLYAYQYYWYQVIKRRTHLSLVYTLLSHTFGMHKSVCALKGRCMY